MALSWTDLENAIAAAVLAASGYSSGQVIWSDQSKGRPSGDFITLRLGDISPDTAMVPSQTKEFTPTFAQWQVTPTAEDLAAYEVDVNGETIGITSGSGATVAEIVASLQAEAETSGLPIAATDMTSYLLVEATELGVTVEALTGNLDVEQTVDEVQAVTQTLYFPREFTVSIQVFSSDVTGTASARAIAAKIQNSLALPTIRAALNAAGLGLLNSGAVRYVPAINGTAFEGRAVLEPRFSIIDSASETTTYIETVNLSDYSHPPTGTTEDIDI